jgi:hypothetical protein
MFCPALAVTLAPHTPVVTEASGCSGSGCAAI